MLFGLFGSSKRPDIYKDIPKEIYSVVLIPEFSGTVKNFEKDLAKIFGKGGKNLISTEIKHIRRVAETTHQNHLLSSDDPVKFHLNNMINDGCCGGIFYRPIIIDAEGFKQLESSDCWVIDDQNSRMDVSGTLKSLILSDAVTDFRDELRNKAVKAGEMLGRCPNCNHEVHGVSCNNWDCTDRYKVPAEVLDRIEEEVKREFEGIE